LGISTGSREKIKNFQRLLKLFAVIRKAMMGDLKFFLDQALEDMMPKSENDFNNFRDTIFDKYNRSGYLIQRGKYYLFQPFNENEDVPMYYRETTNINRTNQITLENFIKQKFGNVKSNLPVIEEKTKEKKENGYDFESVISFISKHKVVYIDIMYKRK
jgi:hypothetical protein